MGLLFLAMHSNGMTFSISQQFLPPKVVSTANTNDPPDRLLLFGPQQKETPQNQHEGGKANSFEPQTAQITKSFKAPGPQSKCYRPFFV